MFLRKLSKSIQTSLKTLEIEVCGCVCVSPAAIGEFFKNLEPMLSRITTLEIDFKGCSLKIFDHPFFTRELSFLENLKLTANCVLVTNFLKGIQSSRIKKVAFNFCWNEQIRNKSAEELIVSFLQSHRMTIVSIDLSMQYSNNTTFWLPSNFNRLVFPQCRAVNFKGVNILFSPIIPLLNDLLRSESVEYISLDSDILPYIFNQQQICNARNIRVINHDENLYPRLDLKVLVAKFPYWQKLYVKNFDLTSCIVLKNPRGVIRLEGISNLDHEKLNELLLVAKNTDILFVI